jgi:hypothetical protein
MSASSNGFVPRVEECEAQASRILESQALRGAESLRSLLAFLVRWSIDNPGNPPKEYVIATQVLGRGAGFDPQTDPTVRVQIGRLRSKLAEYYMAQGAADPLLLEIPKGRHEVTFSYRTNGDRPKAEGVAGPPTGPRDLLRRIAALALTATVAAGMTWWFTRPAPVARPLTVLWSPFLESPEAPLAIFSNAEFVGSPRDGLRYFRRGQDDPELMLDTYTGVGEVMAVRDLVQLFGALRRPLRIKRGRLLTWDEDKNANLIFIGSPAENAELRVLAGSLGFQLKSRDVEPEIGKPGFWNRKPREGEPPLYLVAKGRPIVEDYALVALLPGVQPGKWALILAGCTTFGTGAAAEFVTHPVLAEELLARLALVTGSRRIRPFEALLHVQVEKGAPTQMRVVTLHER